MGIKFSKVMYLLLISMAGAGCSDSGKNSSDTTSNNGNQINSLVDTDGDGTPDAQDTDDDGDGIADANDAFPLDKNEALDTDGDGIGNTSDTDDDDDGFSDVEENSVGTDPLDAMSQPATSTSDSDDDGVLDADDQWPNDNTKPVLSTLWGAYGEEWSPTGRLPFVGMAGYRDGASIPNITRIVADVTNFGATSGAGTSLDTAAFNNAIAHAKTQVSASNPGVIYVPAGIYEVLGQIHLNKSGLILRGAGRDQTEIRFVNHVDGQLSALTIGGNKDGSGSEKNGLNWIHNAGISNYSIGLDNSKLPTKGDFILHLNTPMSATYKTNLAAQGNRIRLSQWIDRTNNGVTPNLLEQIYGGTTLESKAAGHSTIEQEFIATVINDTTLEMDRPLRFTPTNEVKWGQSANVSLRDNSASWETEEIGVEDLKVWFEVSTFKGHNGVGKEGIRLRSSHSWVKNVAVENADNAIVNLPGTAHNTVSNVILDTQRSGASYGPGVPYFYKIAGHVGISAYGHDHLVDNFDIKFSFIHDISTKNSQGCVFSNGKAVEMNMDHHRQVIYSNVWANLDLGNAHRMWDSTGDEEEGFQSASFNTFWNITSEDPTVPAEAPVWPGDGNWIRGTENWGFYTQNFIAVKGLDEKPEAGSYLDGQPYFDRDDIHLEVINENELWPSNIYEAQKKAYLDGKLW